MKPEPAKDETPAAGKKKKEGGVQTMKMLAALGGGA